MVYPVLFYWHMKLNSFLSGCLITTIVFVGLFLGLQKCSYTSEEPESHRTTEITNDTIPVLIETPTPKDSVVLRYKTVKIPVFDTIQPLNADTLITDSITVEIPITQKVYEDSVYQAWVSGYMPSLDSIKVFQPVTTITHTITNTEIRYRTKRWGIGVQAGIGVTPNKVEPYIGIGVTYNIVTW